MTPPCPEAHVIEAPRPAEEDLRIWVRVGCDAARYLVLVLCVGGNIDGHYRYISIYS